jgi:hypothetical protein
MLLARASVAATAVAADPWRPHRPDRVRESSVRADRPEQLTRYYVTTPGVLAQGAAAPTCTWTPNDTRSLSYWASVDVSSGGLETLYQRRSTIPAFEPTDVHSYPAVHTDHDGTPPGQCTVNVGVAGDTLLIVTMKVADAKAAPSGDPCGEADRFAGSMIGYQGHLAP